MSGSLTVTQLSDLLQTTEFKLGSPKFSQIIQKETFYEIGDRYVNRKTEDMHYGRGDRIKEFVQIKQGTNTVQEVDLFEDDSVTIPNTMDELIVDWKHRTVPIAWERRELLMNKGKERLVDLIVTRRSNMMIHMIEKFEAEFFGAPLSSSNDKKIFGVPFWVLFNATNGFTGANPATHSGGAGGLDTDTYSNWKNYSRTYTNVTEDDLIDHMIITSDDIGFESPISIQDARVGRGKRQRFYTTQTVKRGLAKIGRNRNDNLGVEIAKFEGDMVFNRIPVKGLPILENATNWSLPVPAAPVYCLNMDTFYPVWLEGDYIKQSDIIRHPTKHNTLIQWYDCTYNMVCNNRRMNAVIATGAGNQVT